MSNFASTRRPARLVARNGRSTSASQSMMRRHSNKFAMVLAFAFFALVAVGINYAMYSHFESNCEGTTDIIFRITSEDGWTVVCRDDSGAIIDIM